MKISSNPSSARENEETQVQKKVLCKGYGQKFKAINYFLLHNYMEKSVSCVTRRCKEKKKAALSSKYKPIIRSL